MSSESTPLATEIKVDKKLLDMIEKFDKLWKLTNTSGLNASRYASQLEMESEYIIHHIRHRIGLNSLLHLL